MTWAGDTDSGARGRPGMQAVQPRCKHIGVGVPAHRGHFSHVPDTWAEPGWASERPRCCSVGCASASESGSHRNRDPRPTISLLFGRPHWLRPPLRPTCSPKLNKNCDMRWGEALPPSRWRCKHWGSFSGFGETHFPQTLLLYSMTFPP